VGRLLTADDVLIDLERLHQRDHHVVAYDLTDRENDRVLVIGRSGTRPAAWLVDVVALEVLDSWYLPLPDGGYSEGIAQAINPDGVIVGRSIIPARGNRSSLTHATVWVPTAGE